MAGLSTRQDSTEDVTSPDTDTVPASESDDTAPSSDTASAPEPTPESGPEPAEVVADPPKPARRPSRWAALVAGLSALLVALLVGAVVLLVHNHGVSQRPEQRQVALDAARKVANDLTTVSGENAERQIESLIQESTGPFRDQISGNSAFLKAALTEGNVASTAAVTAAGLEKFEADTASALVTVTAMISNSEVPQGQLQTYRLSVQLQRDGDRWLTSTVGYVS